MLLVGSALALRRNQNDPPNRPSRSQILENSFLDDLAPSKVTSGAPHGTHFGGSGVDFYEY